MSRLIRSVAALAPLMLLASCILVPGKFTSTLDIRADRSFTFTYVGEIIAADPSKGLDSLGSAASTDEDKKDGEKDPEAAAKAAASAAEKAEKDKDNEAKMAAIASELAKEEGYRSVKYLGKNRFLVDYRISGKLSHGFVFPYNPDAQAIFPFLSLDLRQGGRVRVQAPGFASARDKGGDMGMGSSTPNEELDGTFTLTTNAEIVSQNQEDGPTAGPQGRQIVWKVSPLTKTAPMAVLHFKL